MDLGSAIVAVGRASKRSKIGRKLSRRLSMVAKMPSIIQTKFRSDNPLQQSRSRNGRHAVRNFEITIIAPDKTQRLVSKFCCFILFIFYFFLGLYVLYYLLTFLLHCINCPQCNN